MSTKHIIFIGAVISLTIFMFTVSQQTHRVLKPEKIPNDWFINQRAFPQGQVDYNLYRAALNQARELQADAQNRDEAWVLAGPTNIGGRITDVEMVPANFDTIYAGAASGGVFKSVDGGQNWQPIFDDALSLSVGDIALDPADSRTIYVGTGEVNAGGGSLTYGGFGLYRSTDGGQEWQHLGLEDTRYIARVAVDPDDSERIYVAAMGKLFAPNSERGLYRTTDGGQSWENVLFVSDSTGCVDVVVHPHDSRTIYAAMWERIRRPDRRSYGGVTCGLYRSTDSGDTWQELTNGLPHQSTQVGRIGLAIARSNPDVLYAIYADNIGWFDGVYRTTDGGDSWARTNDSVLSDIYSSFGWWFGNIRVDPQDPDVAYAMGLDIYKTTNAGQSWFYASGNIHVDQHGLYVHPLSPNFVVAGNDGGIYISQNGGNTWVKSPNLPITQFYTCEIDAQMPQRLYGGTQDNGTNRTLTGQLDDWQHIYWGDGFYVLVDPTDNNYVYAEYQYGNLARSTDGGYSFYPATNGINPSDRNNWNSPVAFDPSNPSTLYFGTHRVYKSTNRAVSWSPISPDLTDGPPDGNLVYSTVTTIAVSSTDGGVIYAGTDDGHVWVTTNGGGEWSDISTDLPQRWITRVAVDPTDAAIAYVTLSGYRQDIYLPHIFRTTDFGVSWQDISGNLPEAPLNDVIVDPIFEQTLYVASDVGVYATQNPGDDWFYLGTDLPNVPVTDLDVHESTHTLVAGTYGRSMYKIDLAQALAVEDEPVSDKISGVRLLPPYPNPFNPATVIAFDLPTSQVVTLRIFNTAGQRVATVLEEYRTAGHHEIRWDAGQLSSGTYVIQLETQAGIRTVKGTLLK